MIKVLTTDALPSTAGDILTTKIETWINKEMNGRIEIKNIHSNIHSNSKKFGWMVVIEYDYSFDQPD
jgi:hypothetical protein